MTITANWSYPTAIKFGAGRISELADHCKAVGMKKPLLVTDRGLSTMPITRNALDILEAAGLGRAMFAEVTGLKPDDLGGDLRNVHIIISDVRVVFLDRGTELVDPVL